MEAKIIIFGFFAVIFIGCVICAMLGAYKAMNDSIKK